MQYIRTGHGVHGDKAEETQSSKKERDMASDVTYHDPKT